MVSSFQEYLSKARNIYRTSWTVTDQSNTHLTLYHQSDISKDYVTFTFEEEGTHHMQQLDPAFFVFRYEMSCTQDVSHFCYYAAVFPIENHGYFLAIIVVKKDNELVTPWDIEHDFSDERGFRRGFWRDSPIDPHLIDNAGEFLKQYLVSFPEYRLFHVTGLLQ